MHAMHARRGSLESQSLLLHLEDACSFPNGVRQRNGQAAWVFYRFYPYLWVIVRTTARVNTFQIKASGVASVSVLEPGGRVSTTTKSPKRSPGSQGSGRATS